MVMLQARDRENEINISSLSHYIVLAIFFLFYPVSVCQADILKHTQQKREIMVPITIDLQSGFSNDIVIIHINDQKIYYKKNLTTNYAIGFTDSINIQVQEGIVNIGVTVPSKKLFHKIRLDISETLYLGVSIIDDQIHFKVSNKIFDYY